MEITQIVRTSDMARIAWATVIIACIGSLYLQLSPARSPDTSSAEPPPLAEVGHPEFASPHVSPIAVTGGSVFVVNTPADTVDVIDAASRRIVARVHVGIDPVGIGVRPDGKEVWVSNHVSDSVSVIDAEPGSPTYLQVVATVGDFDPETRATRFDEPVGIAFASNEKAYVALSSENQIAVVNVATREVEKTLDITAQDPRAIAVRGDRLYVIPFESNNRTQLSGGNADEIDGDLVTFDAWEHSVRVNNVLSLGHVVDIVKHPDVPDRDLYVFDTETDELVEVVDTVGTLLYGLAVDSTDSVFVAQTDARNDVNGRSGTKKHGLAELENRAFLNQLTRIDFRDGAAAAPHFIDLEPLPPEHPEPGMALATPFGIQISDDDSTLVVTAAASDKLFTVDATTGAVLGRVAVDAVPRGVALQSAESEAPAQAWILNAVANTVSLVDVSNPADLRVVDTILLEDPTHPVVKRGRAAFETAASSTTGTFSCASCHPDGHTDQLLWVLKTPHVTGGDQIMPRSTMPVRGLRDTAPYHWDGVPGDPYGGNNSANIYGEDEPNCDIDDAESTTRHLIDGGIAGTMSMPGDETVNDEGKSGRLSAAQRDDMARFLLALSYPPAQRRSYDNVLSADAQAGFRLFHLEGDHQGQPKPNVCGDCHRMPFLVSTNTPGTGMDAPTWRGAYDRWLILPQGRLNIIGFDFFRNVAERGLPERDIWRFSWAGRQRFDPVWDMVLEGSTGYSGSFARQVTLNEDTAADSRTVDLLDALEQSAADHAVILQADGILIDDAQPTLIALQFDPALDGGAYRSRDQARTPYSRSTLIAEATAGRFVGTFTAHQGKRSDFDHPQPALWTLGPIEQQRGRQEFPILHPGQSAMTLSGRHFGDDARLYVDGRRTGGTLTCDGETVSIELDSLPDVGLHFLQVQTPQGLFSNDFIFHVANDSEAADQLQRDLEITHRGVPNVLNTAVASGAFDEVRRLVDAGVDVNRRAEGGSTPLSTAATFDRLGIASYLIEHGAKVSLANEDGNTPLHSATFFCHEQMVRLLLNHGASLEAKSDRGDTPLDVVSGEWTPELEGVYNFIARTIGLELELERIQQDRPRIMALLAEHAASE